MLSSSHQPLEYRLSLLRFQSHARVADAVVSCSTGKISMKMMEGYPGTGTIVHPDPEPHVLRVLVRVTTPHLSCPCHLPCIFHGGKHILHVYIPSLLQLDPVQENPIGARPRSVDAPHVLLVLLGFATPDALLGRVVYQVRPFLDRDGSRLRLGRLGLGRLGLGRLGLGSADIVVVGEGNDD